MLSPLFPAQAQPWEMPSIMEGSAGSEAHRWCCTFRNEVCTPLPASAEEQKVTLTFSCPLSSGSGVPKTQGGTYNTCAAQQRAKWGILFDFFVPHKTALLPSKMRPQESCAEHPLSPPLPVVLSSSTVSLALSLSTVSARAQPVGREKYSTRRLCRS